MTSAWLTPRGLSRQRAIPLAVLALVLLPALAGSPVGDLPARLTVTDRAPSLPRQPVRALVELAGWLAPVPPAEVQTAVLAFAEACPCEALFEVGLTAFTASS